MDPVAIEVGPRELTAAYKFNGKTFVWRCARCTKMFFLEVEEALANGFCRLTLRQFASHICNLGGVEHIRRFDDDFEKTIVFARENQERNRDPGR
jgi:hypothetical protein